MSGYAILTARRRATLDDQRHRPPRLGSQNVRSEITAFPTFRSRPARVSGMPTRREMLALRAVKPTALRQEKDRPGSFIVSQRASQALPGGVWQVRLASIHVSPHAFPAVQTLVQVAEGFSQELRALTRSATKSNRGITGTPSTPRHSSRSACSSDSSYTHDTYPSLMACRLRRALRGLRHRPRRTGCPRRGPLPSATFLLASCSFAPS
jgi:hypothetical protein